MKNRFYKSLGVGLLTFINAGALHAQTNHYLGMPPGQLAMVSFGDGFPIALIPLVAIIMTFFLVIAVVALRLYFRHEKNKVLHQTIRSMVDKGLPIPPELFTTGGQRPGSSPSVQDPFAVVWPRRPQSDLRRGLLLVGIGIGLLMVVGKVGWIVFCMGAAFLVAAIFTRNDQNNNTVPPKL